MKRIQPGSFLTLHYRLTGPGGLTVADTFAQRPATVSLGSGQWAPALEEHLLGLHEGDEASFELPAGSAFGPRNGELLQRVKKSLLRDSSSTPDAEHRPGDVVQFPTPDGQGSYAGTVREAADDWVLFDFNHPLAGQPVRFDVRVVGVL